jgi:hypothetical protein
MFVEGTSSVSPRIIQLDTPGFYNGQQKLEIEELTQNHVRMIHREIFTGLGAFFTGDRMDKDIHHSLKK